MNIKYTRKFSFFYVAVICTITKEKEQIRACVSHYESIHHNFQFMTKLETKHTLQAQVCDRISTKNETGNL